MKNNQPTTASRRAFLRGAAIAIPAAIVAATPVLAATTPEGAELLARGRELTRAEAAFADADAKRIAARALYDSMCPEIPQDLVLANRDPSPFNWCGKPEVDVEGKEVYRADVPGAGPGFPAGRRYILTLSSLKIDAQDYAPRTRIGREVRRRIPIAEEYEAAVQRAKDASRIEAAAEARRLAGDDLEDLAQAIGEVRALTADGVVIKARAMAACARISPAKYHIGSIMIGPGLAEDIVRIGA